MFKRLQTIEKKAAKVAKIAKAVEGFAQAPMRTTGGAVGKKLGSKKAGQAVGSFIGKITGTGDYVVKSNNLLRASSTLASDAVPQFTRGNNGREVRIRHREYLGKVVASSIAGDFKIQKFQVNPGLISTFPWLNTIANQFDEWRPNGIVFVYKNMSSKWSGTPTLGTICMASDYDVLDPDYTNEIEMNNSDFAVSTNVAANLAHPIECEIKERPTKLLFTRDDEISSNDNLRWFDLCNTFVATYGCQANQICGELWVTYDISFFKTQISQSPSNQMLIASIGGPITVENQFMPFNVDNYRGNLQITTNGDNQITIFNPSVLYPLTVSIAYCVRISATGLTTDFDTVSHLQTVTDGSAYLIQNGVLDAAGIVPAPTTAMTTKTSTNVTGSRLWVVQVAPGALGVFFLDTVWSGTGVSASFCLQAVQIPDTGYTKVGYPYSNPTP